MAVSTGVLKVQFYDSEHDFSVYLNRDDPDEDIWMLSNTFDAHEEKKYTEITADIAAALSAFLNPIAEEV